MNVSGYFQVDGMRCCRVIHFDGSTYFIPWTLARDPTLEEVYFAINQYYQFGRDSGVKRCT